MKKKIIILIMTVVCAFCGTVAFAACDLFGSGNGNTEKPPEGQQPETPPKGEEDGKEEEKPHEHEYKLVIEKPTATAAGSATDKCACGEIDGTVVLPVLTDSRYIKSADTATCSKAGTVSYKITLNKVEYRFNIATPATGAHEYSEGVCECGAVDPNYEPHEHSYTAKSDESGHWTECACGAKTAVKAHSYTYASDNDYHWQVCSVGKETTDKVEHSYADGKCVCGADEPVDPNGVQSIELVHEYGEGKYLWNEKDILAGKYELYGAQLEVTLNNGTVSRKPLTVAMLGGKSFSVGNNEVTVSYGGKTAQFTVFVSPEDGLIEAVAGEFELVGALDTLIFDASRPDGFDFGGLEIKGEFNVKHNGVLFNGYYGQTPVNERFVKGFDEKTVGMQECALTLGNISASPATIGEFNVMGYSAVKSETRVFLSDFAILRNGELLYGSQISPEKPYIDAKNLPEIIDYAEPHYSVRLSFGKADFTVYSGGGAEWVTADNIRSFDTDGYEVSGHTELWAFVNSGERLIKIANGYTTIVVNYTVYNSDNTNIRFCRVNGDDAVLNYELSGGVTLDTIKQDLLKRELYVEYFKPVDGKYVHLVPVTESMIDLGDVDVNSYEHQSGTIRYGGKGIAVNVTKPYTLDGAKATYILKSSLGVNLILSDATFNDLSKGANDVCREIVLYDNGVAMLKHTANGIGNFLIGYELKDTKLTLLRHGIATSFLTVNLTAKTFKEMDLNGVTSGLDYKKYSFTHAYSPDSYLAWSGTFTAYAGETGYDYCYYVNVHLTGWAASGNNQIAGIGYVATWAFGWHNNTQAFVLRLADKDWWFEIGVTNEVGEYELTLIEQSAAS